MEVTITPGRLTGTITPPPSKSQAHRLLIAAALARGTSMVSHVAFSQDILATLSCLEQLGARWEQTDDQTIRMTGIPGRSSGELPRFDCGESGSTLRFLIPVALALAGGGVFTGHGRLMERPQKPYFDLFTEKGIAYAQKDGVLTVRGTLTPGEYALPGNVSSQFFTGLLYALPLLEGDSTLRVTTELESRSYIDMTLDALCGCGITVREEPGEFPVFRIPGGQTYQVTERTVEADWSQAGFWYAARGIGNDVTVTGMNPDSVQGDRETAAFYERLSRPGDAVLDVADCPDLVPPMAALAALRGVGNTTGIVNAQRLRIKESDRLATVTQVLTALGADMEELPDGLTIYGRDSLPGGVTVSAHNDHRIAMMAAVAATKCEQPVTITGAECVRKSYPNFWDDFKALGGRTEICP
ncbi:MAG: 3-phosphoshikimate 1-carboxyvinyltransferase [Oscillospiraceae bacterium]|nr:3-phosphoshikimate 1-carboxyvinyltransferase [Oscillospiraceae bacterium]